MKALIRFYHRIDRLQKAKWYKIAATIVALLAAAGAAGLLMAAPERAPNFLQEDTSIVWTAALTAGWLTLLIWMELSLTFLLIAAGMALIAAFFLNVLKMPGLALAVVGFGTLSFTFMLLIRLLLIIFRYPSRVLAVAHTVVKESVRLRVSAFFIIVLLIILPLIPLFIASEQALRYKIQAFISYSTAATFYLAAFMTVFLACGTVAFEIRDRQIWQLLTKPLSRAQYLIGKWLGIVAVNLVILIVAGLSIFIFVQYLRDQPAANPRDEMAVDSEVLVARVAAHPTYERIDDETLSAEITRRIDNDYELKQAIERGERSEMNERRRIARQLQEEYLREQRTIPAGAAHEFTFHGLGEARNRRLPMKLRYRIHYGEDSTHENHRITFLFFKNGLIYQPPREVMSYFVNPQSWQYVPTMSHTLDLPWELVGDEGQYEGTVKVAVINGLITPDGDVIPDPGAHLSFNFDPEDLEILYTVGGFEANYFRAMLVYWVKLAFIAMLGLAAATVLSFPVACMLTLTVFLAATIGPFLSQSLELFDAGHWWRIDRWIIKLLAQLMVFLFEPFGEYNPTERLVDGRLIAWSAVAWAFFLLGVLWSGITLGIGYLAFRDKELATYSGHG